MPQTDYNCQHLPYYLKKCKKMNLQIPTFVVYMGLKKIKKVYKPLAQEESDEELISKCLEGKLKERSFNDLQKHARETCNREG